MDLIVDNYIRSYGNGTNWRVEIDAPKRPVKSYYEETVMAAELIWSQKQGKLRLCLSGGLDSEYVLAVFQSLGMNIEPVIMRTVYNKHDIDYAIKFCQSRNIKHTIIDLDFDHFVNSGKFLQIAEENKCAAFQMPANLWLMSQLDGTILTGDSDPHLILVNDKWYMSEIEPVYCQLEFFSKNRIHGTPFFLSYTPGQMLSFLKDPTIVSLSNNEIEGKLGSYSSKVHVYNNHSKFKLEQRVKQHGYEYLMKCDIFNHPDIQLVESWKSKWWGSYDFEYTNLVSRLSSGLTAC